MQREGIKMKKRLLVISVAVVLLVNGCGSAPLYSEAPPSEEPAYEAEPAYEHPAEEEYDFATAEEWFDDAPSDYYQYDDESYLVIDENRAESTEYESTVTLSLKVDTASYTNVARYIHAGELPPEDAVKTEEFLNYFSYDNKMKDKQGPFYLSAEVGESPYDEDKQFALIRVKTDDIPKEDLPPSNLTFLIDTSGSMDSHDKLPLLQEAFSLLVDTLDEDDRVSIVTYAGSSRVILDSATGADKFEIMDAIDSLEAGGSTYGEGGIQKAYKLAERNYIKNGNNRIILATDGDFNVGVSSTRGLEELISEKKDSGINLSILGFGMGNLKDDNMETLSKYGEGNYSYINSVKDARKVLVDELGSTLFTVAKDVKAQVEFNPAVVKSYRLLGYENRMLNNEDFDDDNKDAGEIGAGTDVVMMFELEMKDIEDSKYQDELFELRIRYKEPDGDRSEEIVKPVYKEDIVKNESEDFKFACAVVGFSHLLRGSDALGNLDIRQIGKMATNNRGDDEGKYRKEFVRMIGTYMDTYGSTKTI